MTPAPPSLDIIYTTAESVVLYNIISQPFVGLEPKGAISKYQILYWRAILNFKP